MTPEEFNQAAQIRKLMVLGHLSPQPDPCLPKNTKTVVLIGPDDENFWPVFKRSPEILDGTSDPLDRWSKRVIDPWANDIGATALYPSDGPPYPPFIAWAKASSTLEQSPVGLFVHAKAGLFVSFRAALALPYELSTKQTTPPPCDSCIPQPCRRACPVNALKGDHYDVAACHAHLATDAGADCMAKGCRARRACPVSQACGRVDEQSAFHMKAFFKP